MQAKKKWYIFPYSTPRNIVADHVKLNNQTFSVREVDRTTLLLATSPIYRCQGRLLIKCVNNSEG